VSKTHKMSFDMRILTFCVFAAATLISGNASAQPGAWASTPEGKARWDACYKETRLMHRTRNMSSLDFRRIIKEARRDHMRVCMARAKPPAPVRVAVPTDKHPETALAGWASNN
jgi:hypothetical protein